MYRFLAIYILFVLNTSWSWGQDADGNIPFEKEFFTEKQHPKLKEARKNFKTGEGFIVIDGDYKSAAKFLLKANRFNPNNSKLNYLLGECYALMPNKNDEVALNYLKRSTELTPVYRKDSFMKMGSIYHQSHQWTLAINAYQSYLNSLDSAEIKEIKKVQKKITACENGLQLSKNPIKVIIKNLGKGINTSNSEYGTVILPDEKNMLFTSKRKSAYQVFKDESDEYYEGIFSAQKNGETWSRPKELSAEFNSEGHDAVISISKSGKTLVLYKGIHQGDLYFSKVTKNRRGYQYSPPITLGKAINSSSRESSGCFSPDGNIFYFSSDRPGGKGGLDLYYSERIKGEWQKPINMETLNSPYDEEGPFISENGKKIYFSSEGHQNVGGFDIFFSELKGGQWSTPTNLGYPLNSPADELYPFVEKGDKTLFFSSHREDSYGKMDVYYANIIGAGRVPVVSTLEPLFVDASTNEQFKQKELESMLYTLDLLMVNGVVLDSVSKAPLMAKISVFDLEKKVSKGVFNTNRQGKFSITIPYNSNISMTIEAKNHLFFSDNFQINKKQDLAVEKTFLLQNIKSGSTIVLNNIFFNSGSHELDDKSKTELDVLIRFMKQNPKIKIEISGHTDNTGNRRQNVELSHERARSVVTYLSNNGITNYRLKFWGYADEKPIADNKTLEGRAMNRRTEFKIVE